MHIIIGTLNNVSVNCCCQCDLDKPRVGEDYSIELLLLYSQTLPRHTYTISIVMLNFCETTPEMWLSEQFRLREKLFARK
ncbi:unnamed protein product, partial [Heterotrigona itama]